MRHMPNNLLPLLPQPSSALVRVPVIQSPLRSPTSRDQAFNTRAFGGALHGWYGSGRDVCAQHSPLLRAVNPGASLLYPCVRIRFTWIC